MNTNVTSHDALVDNYLRAVREALTGVPAYRRDELLDDLREHIAAGRAEFGPDETEAEVRSLLDHLGDPAEVAAEARLDAGLPLPGPPPLHLQPSKRTGAMVRVLIALGAFAVLCVGMLLVGLLAFASGGSMESPTKSPAPATDVPTPARS